jgi:hypothetical protein
VKIDSVYVGNDPQYAVYQVDTSDFDLLFDGGALAFTLEVREGAAAVQEIPVTLNVAPTIIKDSITIFSVTRTATQTGDEEGSLTKINAELEVEGQSVAVATLFDAFKWIDTKTTVDNIEYLIRVQKDEKIPRLLLSGKPGIIRLRGYQEERKITWDGTNTLYHNNFIHYSSYNKSLIHIGIAVTEREEGITLQFEQNITLDGEHTIPDKDDRVRTLVTIWPGSFLIMKSGSKLTGYNFNNPNLTFEKVLPIYLYTYSDWGQFRKCPTFILDGGEITGNTVREGVIFCIEWADMVPEPDTYPYTFGVFEYKNGKIYDNVKFEDTTDHGNYRLYYNEDGSPGKKDITKY